MRTFIYTISTFFVGFFSSVAQQQPNVYPEVYGLRIGTDLIKASRNFWDKDYKGF